MKSLLLAIAISISGLTAGILQNTLIRTGYKKQDVTFIEDLRVGDKVASFQFHSDSTIAFLQQVKITRITSKLVKSVMRVKTDHGCFLIGIDALVYLGNRHGLQRASKLRIGDLILDAQLFPHRIIGVSYVIGKKIKVYDITLKGPHYLFICDDFRNTMLVHNMNEVVFNIRADVANVYPQVAICAAGAAVVCKIAEHIYLHCRRTRNPYSGLHRGDVITVKKALESIRQGIMSRAQIHPKDYKLVRIHEIETDTPRYLYKDTFLSPRALLDTSRGRAAITGAIDIYGPGFSIFRETCIDASFNYRNGPLEEERQTYNHDSDSESDDDFPPRMGTVRRLQRDARLIRGALSTYSIGTHGCNRHKFKDVNMSLGKIEPMRDTSEYNMSPGVIEQRVDTSEYNTSIPSQSRVENRVRTRIESIPRVTKVSAPITSKKKKKRCIIF